jgi:uncharacterized protein (DUF58 family)
VDRARHPRARSGTALARRLRPRRTLRPTRAGWVFFALTFGVGFAALNTGNNLLYLVLAFMLSFLVLSGVFSESVLRGIDVRRRLPREIFAGRGAPVALEIRNQQSRVPSFALVVEDLAEDGSTVGRVFALRVEPHGSELRTYAFVSPERGPFALRGFRVSTRFPFGLFSKSMILERPQEALVYPQLDLDSVRRRTDADIQEGEAPRHDLGAGHEVAGLREYATGDSWRRVHWRASLRRGDLFVRETESERNNRIDVHLRRRAADFEKAVRRAASEVVAFLDAGLRVSLQAEEHHFDAGAGQRHRTQLLTFLALVEPEA